MKRIASLDGLRGVAIALVLFDHIQDSILHNYMRPWTRTGIHGVTIFFILSGYLITSKLIVGPIRLKDFYLRRLARLMPAAWVFLASMIIVQNWLSIPLCSASDLIACLLFYRNFIGASTGSTGHFWSLSIEEQFYFFWPCILLFAGNVRARWIAILGLLGWAMFRFLNWSAYEQGMAYTLTQVHMDALFIGCLLALLLQKEKHIAIAKSLSKYALLPACGVVSWCVFRFHVLIPLGECVALAVIIATALLHPSASFSRALAFKPLAWLGTVSYSIYLWQEPFMRFRSVWVIGIGVPIFALSSYYLIERPFIHIGRRLTASPKTGLPERPSAFGCAAELIRAD